MDFRLDEEQLALQDAVRAFCADRFPLEGVARREGGSLDRSAWRAMGEIGILGVMAPEVDGGSGLGPVEAAIVLEMLGAHLAPVPVLWSLLAAPLVPGVSSGGRVVGGLDATAPGDEPILVEHAAELDTLVILRPDGIFVSDRADLPLPVAVAPLDPLTPVGEIASVGRGAQLGDAGDASRIRRLGTALSAAMLVGVSAAALDTAQAYALERRQFGVPIGSFQAIKHLLADMYVRTSLARSAAFAAAALLQSSGGTAFALDPDVATAAAGAKLLAGEAAIGNGRVAVQVLGGVGYTWAMLPHYLLKRAWVLEHLFGTSDALADAIASGLVAHAG